MDATVENGKVVFINFTLKDGEGQERDTSGDEPYFFLIGSEAFFPQIEEELLGKKVGDKVAGVMAPEDAYGERTPMPPQQVSRADFPDGMEIEIGMVLLASIDEDSEIPVWVTAVDEEWVELDTNHPLSGMTLHYDVDVVRIRDASEEELEHGHVHGPEGTEGHHHH